MIAFPRIKPVLRYVRRDASAGLGALLALSVALILPFALQERWALEAFGELRAGAHSDSLVRAFWHSSALVALVHGALMGRAIINRAAPPTAWLIPGMRARFVGWLIFVGAISSALPLTVMPASGFWPLGIVFCSMHMMVFAIAAAGRHRWNQPGIMIGSLAFLLVVILWPRPFLLAATATPALFATVALGVAAWLFAGEFQRDTWRSRTVMKAVSDDDIDLSEFDKVTEELARTGKWYERWLFKPRKFHPWPHGLVDGSLKSFVRAARYEGNAIIPRPRALLVYFVVFAVFSLVGKVIGGASDAFLLLLSISFLSTGNGDVHLIRTASRRIRARLVFISGSVPVAAGLACAAAAILVANPVAEHLPQLFSAPRSRQSPLLLAAAFLCCAPVAGWIKLRYLGKRRSPNSFFGGPVGQMLLWTALLPLVYPLASYMRRLLHEQGTAAGVALVASLVLGSHALYYLALRHRFDSQDLLAQV